MRPLSKRDILLAREGRGVLSLPPRDDLPLQASLGRDPWKIAVASMLLCRTRRIQAEPAFLRLNNEFGGPALLARADEHRVAAIIRGCGLVDSRARRLVRFANRWYSEYEDFRELPGVGAYVADAVGLFCFDCTDLDSNDGVLHAYAQTIA